MDFDKAVAAFQKRKRGQDIAAEKRQAYIGVLQEYQSLKFGKVVDGVREVKEITQDRIDKLETDKRETSVDIADSLASFVDIEIKAPAPKKAPAKRGKPRKEAAPAPALAPGAPDPLAFLDLNIGGVKL